MLCVLRVTELQLEPLWEAHACETYRTSVASLAREVGFVPGNIPQLADISEYLRVRWQRW